MKRVARRKIPRRTRATVGLTRDIFQSRSLIRSGENSRISTEIHLLHGTRSLQDRDPLTCFWVLPEKQNFFSELELWKGSEESGRLEGCNECIHLVVCGEEVVSESRRIPCAPER